MFLGLYIPCTRRPPPPPLLDYSPPLEGSPSPAPRVPNSEFPSECWGWWPLWAGAPASPARRTWRGPAHSQLFTQSPHMALNIFRGISGRFFIIYGTENIHYFFILKISGITVQYIPYTELWIYGKYLNVILCLQNLRYISCYISWFQKMFLNIFLYIHIFGIYGRKSLNISWYSLRRLECNCLTSLIQLIFCKN